MLKLKHKKSYKIVLFLAVSLIILALITLFALNLSLIIKSLKEVEGIWGIVIILSIRISLLSGMTIFMFNRWFKQEEQFISDIPHLFGIFLLVLTVGKVFDLFWDLTYFRFDEEFVLLLLKIRYFIIILTFIPLMYLSIIMFLYSLSLRESFKKLNNENFKDRITITLLSIITIIEMLAIIMAPNVFILGRILPFILIPSLLVIAYIFYFAYKHQRLTQVHPLILSIGFLIYMISSIFRPVVQAILGETPRGLAYYLIVAETIDLIVFIVIFFGLYMKATYSKD